MIDAVVARRWWARPFLVGMPVICVDPRNPFAIRTMIQQVKDRTRLVLFPEGRISETGGLMKIYDGAGMIADKAAAKLVPVRIEGTQFTRLSYLRGKLRRRWFPRISITVLPPLSLSLDPALLGRPRRHAAARLLRDVMVDAAFATQNLDRTLFSALIDAGNRHGWRTPVLRDADSRALDYRHVLVGVYLLGRALAMLTATRRNGGRAAAKCRRSVRRLHGAAGVWTCPGHAECHRRRRGHVDRLPHRSGWSRDFVAPFAEHGRMQKTSSG